MKCKTFNKCKNIKANHLIAIRPLQMRLSLPASHLGTHCMSLFFLQVKLHKRAFNLALLKMINPNSGGCQLRVSYQFHDPEDLKILY